MRISPNHLLEAIKSPKISQASKEIVVEITPRQAKSQWAEIVPKPQLVAVLERPENE